MTGIFGLWWVRETDGDFTDLPNVSLHVTFPIENHFVLYATTG